MILKYFKMKASIKESNEGIIFLFCPTSLILLLKRLGLQEHRRLFEESQETHSMNLNKRKEIKLKLIELQQVLRCPY